MSDLRRKTLRGATGYTPGEQPRDVETWLKLNTNESPLPSSPTVAPAMTAAINDLRRYPDPFGEPLRSALAAFHGVGVDQILVGNGADSILDWCFRAFVDPGDRVALTTPTYSLLRTLADISGAAVVDVPVDEDWRVPHAIGASTSARLRFVVNPAAPTGVWTHPAALAELLSGCDGVTVVDEAYADFAPESALSVLFAHPSWLVVRTFSKGYALAGLRVGYAVGAAPLIEDLAVVKDSYPVDRGAIAGAVAALADSQHHEALVNCVKRERGRLASALEELGWEVLPSEANYLFARPAHASAADVAMELRSQRILVRHFDQPRVRDWLRITLGTPAETDRLLTGLMRSEASP